MFQRKINLPRTVEEFDALVNKVITKYNIEHKEHAASVIIGAIKRIPVDQGYTTLEYLGNTVIKAIAYTICEHKSNVLGYEAHVAEMKRFAEMLSKNPFDQEGRDGLEKAANAGSKVAKDILSKLNLTGEEPANIISIGGQLVGDIKK
jgi:hypothetical protein